MTLRLQEKKLIYRIRTHRDPEAYAVLYDHYIARIYRFLYFKVSQKEEAEDLTSEVFLKTWNYLIDNNKKDIKSFSGLIYRVARSKLTDFYRQRAQRNECALDEIITIAGGEDQIQRIDTAHDMSHILRSLKRLKHEYQEIIFLRYIEELSVKEIAEVLGKSGTNIRVTLHRALSVLKKILEDNNTHENHS